MDNKIKEIENLFAKNRLAYHTKFRDLYLETYNKNLNISDIESFIEDKNNLIEVKHIEKLIKQARTQGIKNSFEIHEHLSENVKEYSTILEFDKQDWEYQHKHKTMTGQKEYLNLYLPETFVSWLEDKENMSSYNKDIQHGSLVSARFYILEHLEKRLFKVLDKLIPNLLIVSEDRETENRTIMNFEYKCAGLEEEYKIIKKYLLNLIYTEANETINEYLNPYSNYTFKEYGYERENDDLEDNIRLIIGGKAAAANINFNNILHDIKTIQQPLGLLKNLELKIFKIYKKQLKQKIKEVVNLK